MEGFGVQKSIPLGNISEGGISLLLLYGTSDTTFIGSRLFTIKYDFIKGNLSRGFIVLLSQ